MRVYLYLILLTLVLSFQSIHAAPVISGVIQSPKLEDKLFDEVPIPGAMKANRFALGIGFSSGSILEKGEYETSPLLTLNYRNIFDPRKLEADIVIHNSAIVGAFLGTRWSASQDSPWLVYYKASGGMYLPAKDGPAGIAALKRLQARALLGWENFYELNKRVQSEVGIGMSVVGFELIGNISYIISL